VRTYPVVWANPGKTDKGKQEFRKYSRCIFTGKCKQVKNDSTNREEARLFKSRDVMGRWSEEIQRVKYFRKS
jgi:hypothetical protein